MTSIYYALVLLGIATKSVLTGFAILIIAQAIVYKATGYSLYNNFYKFMMRGV